MGLDAQEIAAVYQGFRHGRPEEVRTVRRWIDGVVRGRGWRFADPEGVAQEILLRTYHLARSGAVEEPGAFQKLVQVLAKNRCVSQYHRERLRERHELPEPGDEPVSPQDGADDAMIRREQIELARQVVQSLPGACRTLWGWVYHDRLDSTEIGSRLGITAGNVRVRVHRCLELARGAYRRAAEMGSAAAGVARGGRAAGLAGAGSTPVTEPAG